MPASSQAHPSPPRDAVDERDADGSPVGHRERLIAAMATSIEERGYRDTTVADVVRLARTSRRNFYEHFDDRDACFLALFDATNQEMLEEIEAAVAPDRPLDDQVDAAVDAYISNVAGHPALYSSFVRELPGLGDQGAVRGQATLERFAEMLVGLVDRAREVQPGLVARSLDLDTAIIIVGGLRELLVISLQQRRDLRALRTNVGRTIKAILIGTLL
ncbi:MAG: TetR/AcrR family transcriptional regulator [Solirubrobacteraceae bacterium]